MASKIKTIREHLPHGAQKTIATKAGVSRATVVQVLSGKSKNLDVLKAIDEFLKEQKKKETEILDSIQKTLNLD